MNQITGYLDIVNTTISGLGGTTDPSSDHTSTPELVVLVGTPDTSSDSILTEHSVLAESGTLSVLFWQMNQITGYLDGSNIYGSGEGAQRSLREFRGGRLRIQNIQGKQMLPPNPNECRSADQRFSCFLAGLQPH